MRRSKNSSRRSPQGRSTAVINARDCALSNQIYGGISYASTIGRKTVYAPSISKLIEAGVSTELDLPALNVFLRAGFFLGDSTPFRHIKVTNRVDPAQLGIRRLDLTRTQAIEGYINVFREAVLRSISATQGMRFCMGLSGGRDSRHVLLELLRLGSPPDLCWTVGMEEASTAKALALRAKVPHTTIPRADSKEQAKNINTNFESLQHGWIYGAREIVSAYDAIYDGIGGDVLSAGLFLSRQRLALLEARRFDELAETLLIRTPLPGVIDQSLFPARDAIAAIREELQRHIHMPDPISSFYFFNRTRREIGSSSFSLLCPTGQLTCAPFLDSEVVRFLAGLTPEITGDQNFHTEVIARAYPEFADMPYAAKDQSHIDRRDRRTGIAEMRTLLFRRSGLLRTSEIVARLLRAALVPGRAAECRWLSTYAPYILQVESFQSKTA